MNYSEYLKNRKAGLGAQIGGIAGSILGAIAAPYTGGASMALGPMLGSMAGGAIENATTEDTPEQVQQNKPIQQVGLNTPNSPIRQAVSPVNTAENTASSLQSYYAPSSYTTTQFADGGKVRPQDRPGGSNVGKYPDVHTFAGPSGGAPNGSYPINTIDRGRSALKLAHNAPNPEGIKKAVYSHYPSLRKAMYGAYNQGGMVPIEAQSKELAQFNSPQQMQTALQANGSKLQPLSPTVAYIGGRRHTQGGTPLNMPSGSHIVPDYDREEYLEGSEREKVRMLNSYPLNGTKAQDGASLYGPPPASFFLPNPADYYTPPKNRGLMSMESDLVDRPNTGSYLDILKAARRPYNGNESVNDMIANGQRLGNENPAYGPPASPPVSTDNGLFGNPIYGPTQTPTNPYSGNPASLNRLSTPLETMSTNYPVNTDNLRLDRNTPLSDYGSGSPTTNITGGFGTGGGEDGGFNTKMGGAGWAGLALNAGGNILQAIQGMQPAHKTTFERLTPYSNDTQYLSKLRQIGSQDYGFTPEERAQFQQTQARTFNNALQGTQGYAPVNQRMQMTAGLLSQQNQANQQFASDDARLRNERRQQAAGALGQLNQSKFAESQYNTGLKQMENQYLQYNDQQMRAENAGRAQALMGAIGNQANTLSQLESRRDNLNYQNAYQKAMQNYIKQHGVNAQTMALIGQVPK